jgi:hypothetical protein
MWGPFAVWGMNQRGRLASARSSWPRDHAVRCTGSTDCPVCVVRNQDLLGDRLCWCSICYLVLVLACFDSHINFHTDLVGFCFPYEAISFFSVVVGLGGVRFG